MNGKQIHRRTMSALGMLVAALLLVAACVPAGGNTPLIWPASTSTGLPGVGLGAWLAPDGRPLLARADEQDARQSMAMGPYLQKAKLTASQRSADDGFAWSVAISGSTVVVAAWMDDVGDNEWQGSAYVFVRPAAGWTDMTPVAKLTASDGQDGDGFGSSVAISGNTVVVGAYDHDWGGLYD
jgi:hypothetical protein